MLKRLSIGVAMMMFVSACATAGPETVATNEGEFCLIAEPIYVSVEDELTGETARAILRHNEMGAEMCGW